MKANKKLAFINMSQEINLAILKTSDIPYNILKFPVVKNSSLYKYLKEYNIDIPDEFLFTYDELMENTND